MKRFVIILILALGASVAVQGQHFVGIKGGWGVGDARFYPNYETPLAYGMLNGGVTWRYYTENPRSLVDRYAGGIAAELEFIQRGFRREMFGDKNVEYKRTVNSVILPFMWQPHFYMAQKRFLAFFNAGLTLQYNISSKEYLKDLTTGIETESDYEMLAVRDNRWGYGLCGGVGFGYNAGRVTILAEGRYYFGYSDILKRKTVYEDNFFMRSPLDNIMISFGMSYRLGKDLGDEGRQTRRAARRELQSAVEEVTQ